MNCGPGVLLCRGSMLLVDPQLVAVCRKVKPHCGFSALHQRHVCLHAQLLVQARLPEQMHTVLNMIDHVGQLFT